MSKLAQVMATEEGYFVTGSLPQRRNNPLDLRHSPHASHDGEGPNDIGNIDTPEDGWLDADEQLQKYAARGLTVAQMVAILAPPSENNTAQYIDYVCKTLPCAPEMLVRDALQIT